MRRGDGAIREWPDGTPREHPDWKPTGAPILKFELVDSREGAFWAQCSGDELVAQIVGIAKRVGARQVHSDQRESLLLRAAIERNGLKFFEHPWSSQNKVVAVESLRRAFRDRTIWLPTGGKGEALRKELLRFEEHIAPSGGFTYGGRSSHDDLVALLLTASMADSDPGLPRSPGHRPAVRGRGLLADIGIL